LEPGCAASGFQMWIVGTSYFPSPSQHSQIANPICA
jgi:hypothetical protein